VLRITSVQISIILRSQRSSRVRQEIKKQTITPEVPSIVAGGKEISLRKAISRCSQKSSSFLLAKGRALKFQSFRRCPRQGAERRRVETLALPLSSPSAFRSLRSYMHTFSRASYDEFDWVIPAHRAEAQEVTPRDTLCGL